MITFNEFLAESKASWDGMRFTVIPVSGKGGLRIQFMPDSRTLDMASLPELASQIKTALDKKMPLISSVIHHDTTFEGAGVVFSIDPYEFSNLITKQLK